MGEGVNTIRSGQRTRSTASIERNSTPKVDMNSRKFKSATTRAERLTDWNNHGEASMTVAKAFGYNDLADKYKAINKEHERVGSLTPDLYQQRNAVDSDLRKRVERDYGEEGLRHYRRAL